MAVMMDSPVKQLWGNRGAWLRGALFQSPLGQYDCILSPTLVKAHTPHNSDPAADKGSCDRAEWATKSNGSKN